MNHHLRYRPGQVVGHPKEPRRARQSTPLPAWAVLLALAVGLCVGAALWSRRAQEPRVITHTVGEVQR